ncbi:DMT family transporter [Paenibacillus sp. CF384]|uniref:DMT family transporter n=1 Tax=Paenibacillus sp. CF384 TaxID=1884382 RepID=UPI00089958B6|nr:DMT family transporter [Paenibacillus sp. CF384]SDW97178.1 EamA-like transporter family protein [Paenibacillus sp. CF384]
MLVVAVFLVLFSGLTHAVWNLFAKRSLNKAAFLWIILLPSTVFLIPLVISGLLSKALPWQAYVLILITMLIQGCYAFLLTKAYTLGDLSQMYPIMRGTATLLVPTVGVAFLGESLSVWGWAGILCMIVSFFKISDWSFRRSKRGRSSKPILVAFGVGLCTTCYVFVDKLTLDYLSPPELLCLGNAGFLLALTPVVLRSGKWKTELKTNWRVILMGAVLSPGSYLLFLFAMNLAPMAHISPIREIGTVFATLLGILVLKEQQGMKRIASSAAIASAIVVISVFG